MDNSQRDRELAKRSWELFTERQGTLGGEKGSEKQRWGIRAGIFFKKQGNTPIMTKYIYMHSYTHTHTQICI